MKTIYKYVLNGGNVSNRECDTAIEIPSGEGFERARYLHAGLDANGAMCVWIMLDTAVSTQKRLVLYVRGTGHDCGDVEDKQYIGCVLQTPYVFHVFGDAP